MLRTPATPTKQWAAQGRWLKRLRELEAVIVAAERGEPGDTPTALMWELAKEIARLEVGE